MVTLKGVQNMSDRTWDLLVELRKELVESQKLRARIIGFKITFVSAAAGLIATKLTELDAAIFVIPAFASVFFDFLIQSYSFSIKRIGSYIRDHIEPALILNSEMPGDLLQWQAHLTCPHTKQRLAVYGVFGFTLMMVLIGIVSLFLPFRPLLSIPLLALLVLFSVVDIFAYRAAIKIGEPMAIVNDEN